MEQCDSNCFTDRLYIVIADNSQDAPVFLLLFFSSSHFPLFSLLFQLFLNLANDIWLLADPSLLSFTGNRNR